MIKSQSERYLESHAPDRYATDEPFEFERVKLPGVNLDMVMQFERKMREYNEDSLIAEIEAMCEIIQKAVGYRRTQISTERM